MFGRNFGLCLGATFQRSAHFSHYKTNYSSSFHSTPSYQQTESQGNLNPALNQHSFDLLSSVTARPYMSEELAYAKDQFSSFIQKTLAGDSTLSKINLEIWNPNYLSLSAPVTILQRNDVR